jgi:ATP/ADP translocase
MTLTYTIQDIIGITVIVILFTCVITFTLATWIKSTIRTLREEYNEQRQKRTTRQEE